MKPYFAYEHFVTFSDTNLVGNVYFANHVAWQGECRERFLAEHAPGVVADLTAGELALVTVSCSCHYFGELYALDRVSVRMSLRAVAFNQVTMDFTYYRVGSGPAQLVARGEQAVACMRRDGAGALAPVEVPEELRLALEGYSAAGLVRAT
ncbi:acyl-CoA thioesterase [Sphaerisporangium sp. TRM90804]|uniref:acyl-CoA thioesterase n=1 Tax=Sphaerisporangium sp. TRM90804 TaxID=3031113 RepID=UPI0024472F8A|nr:acyl-CoA thioesterase [Sphaerisporangium sp. TRM90804]MDH2429183.1 acyl-CoA thioesterase [Sphaerisporangium sp. TRM90804]